MLYILACAAYNTLLWLACTINWGPNSFPEKYFSLHIRGRFSKAYWAQDSNEFNTVLVCLEATDCKWKTLASLHYIDLTQQSKQVNYILIASSINSSLAKLQQDTVTVVSLLSRCLICTRYHAVNWNLLFFYASRIWIPKMS